MARDRRSAPRGCGRRLDTVVVLGVQESISLTKIEGLECRGDDLLALGMDRVPVGVLRRQFVIITQQGGKTLAT
jgi:hypothetical protein